MASKEEKEWTKWMLIGALILVVFFVIGSFFNSNESSIYEDDNVGEPKSSNTNNFNYETMSETITISGLGESITITNSNSLKVVISGMENIISFAKQSNPKTIVISGLGNTIYLCEGIHSPSIQNSGLNNIVEYIGC